MRRRRLLAVVSASVTVLAGCTGSRAPDRPTADDALVVESSYPIEGTMVNVGVGGTASNAASTALVDCRVEASGTVGDREFVGTVERARLGPGETWEWEVAFVDEADAQRDDSVEDVSVETVATYAG